MLLLIIGLHNYTRVDFRFNHDPELSAICTELWELDENRLRPGIDYRIDLQGCM